MSEDFADLFAPDGIQDGPVFTDLQDVQIRDIQWLDRPFLPWGELVTMNADGDTGKGLFAVFHAARLSRARRMAVFASAEDRVETVLKPRLIAAGADLRYIRGVSWKRRGTNDALRIPNDIPELERALIDIHASMLVIDPLLSHISAKTDSYVDHQVKLALMPLLTLAHRTGCLVLGNGHFTKSKSAGARIAVLGSGAFTNTPRVALAMAVDVFQPAVRVVGVIKSNVGPKNVVRRYTIGTRHVPGLSEDQPLLLAAPKTADENIDEVLQGTSSNGWHG